MAEYIVDRAEVDTLDRIVRLGGRKPGAKGRWTLALEYVISFIVAGEHSFWLLVGNKLVQIKTKGFPPQLFLSEGYDIAELRKLHVERSAARGDRQNM
jgi:hypothetical protein